MLRKRKMDLHHIRFELDDGGEFERMHLPRPVRKRAVACDRAIEEFALVARKHTS